MPLGYGGHCPKVSSTPVRVFAAGYQDFTITKDEERIEDL
jgi:hypothetical protein